MITAIAIDDEPKALEVLQAHALRMPELDLQQVFTSPIRALKYVSENPVDLIFLDINMKELSGMDTAKLLPPACKIIFTTAYPEFAVESYSVNAVDYLLKPFDFARFLSAIQKYSAKVIPQETTQLPFFFVSSGTKMIKIVVNEIMYIEAQGNYVTYHTTTNKTLVRSTIVSTLEKLPQKSFARIHRSLIVSLQHIDKIEDNHIFIKGKGFAIGTSFKDEFYKRIGEIK